MSTDAQTYIQDVDDVILEAVSAMEDVEVIVDILTLTSFDLGVFEALKSILSRCCYSRC